jgi:hypothetical protein
MIGTDKRRIPCYQRHQAVLTSKMGKSERFQLPPLKAGGVASSRIALLASTTLQIASEITTFVGGMGLFIAPPLQKVYGQLIGKNMAYSVNGTGTVCIETQSPFNLSSSSPLFDADPSNPICNNYKDLSLLSSNIPFNLPYPEGLFASSSFLLSLGCSGLLVSFALKKYAASLYEADEEMPPSKALVALAKKNHRPLSIVSGVLFIGSRTAALYATTTMSLMKTLQNIPGILNNFSLYSPRDLIYVPNNTTLIAGSESMALPLVKIIRAKMLFITHLDFSELREAARNGNKNIQEYDYYIGLTVAGVAVVLGYTALKIQQRSERYQDVLIRQKHYQMPRQRIDERDDYIRGLEERIKKLQESPPDSRTLETSTNQNSFFTPQPVSVINDSAVSEASSNDSGPPRG